MNDDGRGFSPWVNHVAETAPPDETRVRGRRARFFSATGRGGGTGLAATFGGGAAGFDTIFARAAGFGGFAAFFFGAATTFFAGRRGAALVRAGRRIAFLTGRLRARAAVFFPCTLAIVQKNGAQYSGQRRLTPEIQPISRCSVSRSSSAIFLILTSSRPSTMTLTLSSVPE